MFDTEDDAELENTDVTAVVCQNELKKTINLKSGPKQVVQAPRNKATVPAKQTADPDREKASCRKIKENNRS